jgi:hypothetical protein
MNQAIANIIKNHISGLDFVDKIAGLTQVLTFEIKNEKNEMVQKSFPIACCVTANDCKDGAYNELMPNSEYKTVIYFEDGGVTFEKSESNWKYYKSKLRLICWINIEKIFGHNCKSEIPCTYAAHIVAEIIRALPEFPENHAPFDKVYSEITSQLVRSPSIFSAYTYDEKHVQYLMAPYDYFALEIDTAFGICLKSTSVFDSSCYPDEVTVDDDNITVDSNLITV